MSTTVSSKNQESTEIDVLRVVPDENAFYFYKALGVPLGTKAKSLIEFLSELKEVDPSSVKFHVERHDFENWLKMLGDSALSDQIAALSRQSLPPEKLRTQVRRIVEARLKSLRAPS